MDIPLVGEFTFKIHIRLREKQSINLITYSNLLANKFNFISQEYNNLKFNDFTISFWFYTKEFTEGERQYLYFNSYPLDIH